MKFLFISNYINHYTAPLIEELNKIEGVDAYFVETEQLPDSFKKSGFKEFKTEKSLIRTWDGKNEWDRAMDLAQNVDVMIISSSSPKVFERVRLKKNLLTFEYTERPLKRGFLNMFSKTNMWNQIHYHLLFREKPLYMLCYSAFTVVDEYRMKSFKGRCFKFGYMPRIEKLDFDAVLAQKNKADVIKFVWCARFISWKHPEMPVLLAEKLRNQGYNFVINMIGSGVLFKEIRQMIKQKGLEQYVHLIGNFPNADVLKLMREHHIFLFTSDKREGWGVVLNEAMGQMCCPIASNMIGSTPYLLKHKKNGLIFHSQDIESLYQNAKFLLDNPQMISMLSKEAYNTVSQIWNPIIAAERLYNLSKNLLGMDAEQYVDGPCSKDFPI